MTGSFSSLGLTAKSTTFCLCLLVAWLALGTWDPEADPFTVYAISKSKKKPDTNFEGNITTVPALLSPQMALDRGGRRLKGLGCAIRLRGARPLYIVTAKAVANIAEVVATV